MSKIKASNVNDGLMATSMHDVQHWTKPVMTVLLTFSPHLQELKQEPTHWPSNKMTWSRTQPGPPI
jgi:hypothetical protein